EVGRRDFVHPVGLEQGVKGHLRVHHVSAARALRQVPLHAKTFEHGQLPIQIGIDRGQSVLASHRRVSAERGSGVSWSRWRTSRRARKSRDMTVPIGTSKI